MGNTRAGASLRDQKVLVTGATGFIGRRVVGALLDRGARVTILARSPKGARALWPGAAPKVVAGDIGDPAAAAAAVEGQEVIINLAYDVRAPASANLAAFETFIAAAEREGRARIVHASSIVVYDGWPDGVISEEAAIGSPGGGPYRQAKIAEEARLMGGALPVAILQPTIVWGPGSALWTTGFAEALLAGAVVLPSPEGLCQGVFVEDVVQACLRAAEVQDPGRERFIINGPTPFAWSALIGGYQKLLGRGEVRLEAAATLAPPPMAMPSAEEGLAGAPSAAARLGAAGRQVLGRDRFEGLVRAVRRRMNRGKDMRPDAHLFALYTAQGDCRSDRASDRLGYRPEYGLEAGLAATAAFLRGLGG